MFNVAYTISSLFVGNYLIKIGRKNSILFGYACEVITTLSFGLISYIEDDNYFLGMAIIIRLCTGTVDAFINTSAMSIITIEFSEQRELFCGYCEMGYGLGLMLGPVFGSIIYSYTNYRDTFYIFTGMVFIGFVVSFFLIPWEINYKKTCDEDESEEKDEAKKEKSKEEGETEEE